MKKVYIYDSLMIIDIIFDGKHIKDLTIFFYHFPLFLFLRWGSEYTHKVWRIYSVTLDIIHSVVFAVMKWSFGHYTP